MHAQIRSFLTIILISFLNLSLFSQSNSPIPLTHEGHNYGKTEIEKDFFIQVEKTQAKLDFNGHILEEDSLLNYLNELVDKLKPEELDTFNIRVSVIKDYSINAGMYPNGRMHINTGFLAEFENEAQLAFVMCHELAHFIYRHSLIKNSVADSINAVNEKKIFYYARERNIESFYEFSRDVELDADSLGLELYLKQNYPPLDAVKSLKKLPPRIKVSISFFKLRYTHPRNEIRINYIENKIKDLPNIGNSNAQIYRQKTKGLTKLNIDLLIRKGDFLNSINRLDTLKTNISDTVSRYYREIVLTQGELYQQFLAHPQAAAIYYNQKEIIEKSGPEITSIGIKKANKYFDLHRLNLEEKTVEILKSFLEDSDFEYRANRALGLFYFFKKDWYQADKYLNKYLETDKKITDRRYIKSVISKIKQ